MKTFEYSGAKSIVVSGDIHGEFSELVYRLCDRYGMTDTLLIVAGLESWLEKDPSLAFDCKEERDEIDKLLYFLKQNGHPLSHWYYGHFHHSWAPVLTAFFTVCLILWSSRKFFESYIG